MKLKLFGYQIGQVRDLEYRQSLVTDPWLSRMTQIVGCGILAHWIAMMLLTHFRGHFTSTVTYGLNYGFLGPLSIIVCIGSFLKRTQRTFLWDIFLMINSVAWVLVTLIQAHLCMEKITLEPGCNGDNLSIRANQGLYITFGPFIHLYTHSTRKAIYGVLLFLIDLYLGVLVFVGDPSQFSLYVLIVVFQLFMFVFAIALDNHRYASYKLRVGLKKEMIEKERAEEKKRQLTGYVFHEIRVPLNTMIQSVNLLEQGNPQQLDSGLIDVLNTGLRSIETLLNDVLDFQKIAEGFFQLNPQPCDIHQSILTVVHVMSAAANAKGVAVSTKLDMNVPRCIILDDFRFRQIVANLVSNAIKFTPECKQITVETALVSPLESDSVEIYIGVIDEGIGISAENIKKLFKPWVQIDAQRNQGGKGSGLGLAICANIVTAIGGTYGIESVEGSGSTFWFRFAAKVANPPPPSPTVTRTSFMKDSPAATLPATSPANAQLRVLIVDDDAISRTLMARIVTSLGHEVSTASDGQEVVDIFAALDVPGEVPYDAMFIDNYMPRMNGSDAIRWLRDHGWTDLIIFCTSGVSLSEEEQEIYKAGANRVLRKPVGLSVIRESLIWVAQARKNSFSGM